MNVNEEHKYDDIINLPHHISKTHPQMPLLDRAAQFAPFAALTGHDAAIKETARLTDERQDLDENTIEIINRKLQLLRERLSEKPVVTISYFEPDEKKQGGTYLRITGTIKKIDEYAQKIYMEDGKKIWIKDLVEVEEI